MTSAAWRVRDEQQGPDVLAGSRQSPRIPRLRPAPRPPAADGAGPAVRSTIPCAASRCCDGIGEMPDGGPAAGDGGDPHGRGQLQLLPQRQFPAGVAGGIPAQQGADAGGVVGGDDHQAALGRRPHQGRGVEPAADGVLPRPQVFPAQQRVAVEQQGRGVPAGGHRLGADGGHHEGLRVRQRWP